MPCTNTTYFVFEWGSKFLVFASELDALRQCPNWDPTIDRNGLASLLKYNYIPEPLTIFSGIKKMRPGWYHSFRRRKGKWEESESNAWWSIQSFCGDGASKLRNRTQIIDESDELIRRVISDQGRADVPIGSFLSGGIDSSLVTAILQDISDKPVQTFTVGFENKDYDEARLAADVANRLGTDHTELTLSADDALQIIQDIPAIYSEPFADSSQIPTAAVCKFSSKFVKVVLSGDGGDEVFGGYNRYLWAPQTQIAIISPKYLISSIA
jgi:asparagine synthase (glutamine-hydrolysing)